MPCPISAVSSKTGGYVGGVTPQRRQCRRAIRARFRCASSQSRWILGSPFSFHPYIRWVPSLGIVALHPPVTLHISPLGHGAGVQRHPRRCVYSSGAVPPRPDPIAMCSLKGSERSQTESQSDAVLPQSIFAHTETSVHLCALSDSKSLHSRLQTATMATSAHHPPPADPLLLPDQLAQCRWKEMPRALVPQCLW